MGTRTYSLIFTAVFISSRLAAQEKPEPTDKIMGDIYKLAPREN